MQLNKALEGHCAHLELGNIELNDTHFFLGVTHSITDPYSDENKSIKMRCYNITEPGNMMPELPGNNDKEGWRRLYIEAKESGDQRVSRSRTAKRHKQWDAVDCAIHDNKAWYFNDSNLTTEENHGPLHELP